MSALWLAHAAQREVLAEAASAPLVAGLVLLAAVGIGIHFCRRCWRRCCSCNQRRHEYAKAHIGDDEDDFDGGGDDDDGGYNNDEELARSRRCRLLALTTPAEPEGDHADGEDAGGARSATSSERKHSGEADQPVKANSEPPAADNGEAAPPEPERTFVTLGEIAEQKQQAQQQQQHALQKQHTLQQQQALQQRQALQQQQVLQQQALQQHEQRPVPSEPTNGPGRSGLYAASTNMSSSSSSRTTAHTRARNKSIR